MAREMESLLTEGERGFEIGRATNPGQTDTYLGYVRQYKPRAASMVKAYCR